MMIQTTTRSRRTFPGFGPAALDRRRPATARPSDGRTLARRVVPALGDHRVPPAVTRAAKMGWREELMTVTVAGLLAFGLSLDGLTHGAGRRTAVGLD